MNKSKKNKLKIILSLSLMLAASIYIGFIYFLETEKKELLVSFIDCGQADCIFIKTPQNHQIIIDFGDNKGLKDLSNRIPWWNKTIDLMIITHPHDDHIAGMFNIIKKYNVKNIMYTGVVGHSPLYLELIDLIKQESIPLVIPNKNQVISFGQKCDLKILFPLQNLVNKEVANLNNSSIVSQLDCLGSLFLFMGDAELEEEQEILNKGIVIKSDVLKAGHHGSITSSQQDFLEKVKPEITIIMVGENNKFNHPSLRTVKKLERIDSQIFRTDLDGTVDILNKGQGLVIKNKAR